MTAVIIRVQIKSRNNAELLALTTLGQAQFLGSIKEVVFEAIERTFVEIRELADLDFSFRLKSDRGDGKAASISPYSSRLSCDYTNVDNPYEPVTNFKLPMVPTIPTLNSSYDIYVEGKLKIRDGEYLPNDMYLHTEGYYASQLTYGMKVVQIYDGIKVAASCYPVAVRLPIPMPYFPTAKIGNFFVETGAELVFGKIEARGEYSITREFRYPFKTTIGVKDGDAQVSGSLGSFSNEIIGSKSTVVGKAGIESGIVANIGLELSPGLTSSVGEGTEFTLATTGLKFGAKIAGEMEAIEHVLVNQQALYSMEKIELGSGPVAEVEFKLPPLPTFEPKKKDWAKPYFKPWKDWALPSYTATTNQADLGAIQAGDNIDIILELGSSGSDPSKVDYPNIQWRAVPEGTVEFSEFGQNRLKARAIPLENDAQMRQIVVTMSHIEGYKHLDKSIVMSLNVTSKACPSEEQFLNKIGRTKSDNNRVHIRPADASDPTQIGECTVKFYESNSQGEWLETEAAYESGLLVNRHSQYQSGVVSQSDSFEIIQLSSGAKSSYRTRTLEQSEDELTLNISNFKNTLNSEGTKVFDRLEGLQIAQYGEKYTEYTLANFRIPDSDNYQQLRVGTYKNIYKMGTENESQYIYEYDLAGLVCDDGSTVEKLDSYTFTHGTGTTTEMYKQFNCPNANYADIVNYLSESREQSDYFNSLGSTDRTTIYLPVFETLPYLEDVQFDGALTYVSEVFRTDYNDNILSRLDYERVQLLRLPAGSDYESRPFYGPHRVLEYGDDLFLAYTEISNYSIHDDEGNLESIYETWFEAKEHQGTNVIVKSHDIREVNTPESYYLTTLGKYLRYVTEYSGGVEKDDREIYHYENGIEKKQYVSLEHEFHFDKAILDGETWSFESIRFDKDASFNYLNHGPYGTYSSLGSQELCQSGTHENGLREGAYFRKPGCYATASNDDDVTEDSNYSNGKLHGTYSRRFGDYLSRGSYNEGLVHGWWRYYTKGNLIRKTRYDNGKEIDSCFVGSSKSPC